MFGELTPEEIDALLRDEIVARIAYVDRRGLPCIVPVTYAYDGHAFYGYSLLDEKVDNMGADVSVCVEVERIQNAAQWCSSTVRGTYETLHGATALAAIARRRRHRIPHSCELSEWSVRGAREHHIYRPE